MSITIKIAGTEYKVDGAAEEDTLLSIENILKKALGNGSPFDPKAQKALTTALNNTSKSGHDLVDSFDDLNDSVGDANDSFDNVVKREAEREKKREKFIAEFQNNLKVGFFSATTIITRGVTDAVQQFSHNLQSASDAQSGVTAISRVIDSSISMIADGIKAIANAIPVIGGLVGGITAAAATGLKFLNQFYAQELTTVFSAYEKIGSEGVLLAKGMTELKTTANAAGLGVSDFSDAVARNADTIRKTGLGMTLGTEKFGQVLASLRTDTEQYSKKLFALGFNTQDQADVVAASMSNLSRSTNIQKMNADDIARESYDYAKNLKIISDITGKTAKQQMEAQQAADLNIAVQTKLAQMGPGATERFNAALAATPDSMHKALEQQLVFGSVIDQQSAMVVANNREVANSLAQTVANIGDTNKSTEEVRTTVLNDWADAQKTIRTGAIAQAAAIADLAGASGSGAELGKTFNTLNVETVNYTRDGITAANKALKELTTNTDPLTNDFADLSLKLQEFKADLENYAMAGTKEYADVIKQSMATIKTALNDMGVVAGTRTGKDAQFTTGNDTVDAVLNGPKALQQSPKEFATGMDQKYPWLAAIDKLMNANSTEGYANGGIASGPTSGYSTMLHGTEAVVPLPDGRSIPVDIDFGDANAGKTTAATASDDGTNKKILLTMQALVDSIQSNNEYTKQIAGMSFEQAKNLQNVANQIDDSNSLLNKIYKTGY